MSLEYLTLLAFLAAAVVLAVAVNLWEAGKPITLLFLLTWPMQPTLGDKGSLEDEAELGMATSLMHGLEHKIGKNVDL